MSMFIKIHPADNVAVAVREVNAGIGVDIDGVQIIPAETIPAGHKVALRDMAEGEDVVKYGFPIGHLLRAVPQGGLIDHNVLKTNLEGLLEYSYQPDLTEVEPAADNAFFKGYRLRTQWIDGVFVAAAAVCLGNPFPVNSDLNNYNNTTQVEQFSRLDIGADHLDSLDCLPDIIEAVGREILFLKYTDKLICTVCLFQYSVEIGKERHLVALFLTKVRQAFRLNQVADLAE